MLNSFFYLVNQGFKNLWNNRLMSLASIGVLVSCMLLIGAAALLSVNVSSIVDAVEDQSEAIVYLEDGLDDAAVEEVRDGLIATGKVATIEFISKEDALHAMMESMGDDGMLFEAYKKENNLPDSFRITFDDVSDLENTVMHIEALLGVDSVSALTEVANVITGIFPSIVTVLSNPSKFSNTSIFRCTVTPIFSICMIISLSDFPVL